MIAASLLDMMICRIPGLKGSERVELVKRFDREAEFSALSREDIGRILGRTFRGRPWTMDEIKSQAEKDAASALKLGIQWVSWRETAYPPLLREIYDPPALLFYRGILPDPEKPLAAVVGTRKPSSRAAARAYALGREFGAAGIPVVSGLALGIDSLAHRGNIEGGAPTVAVLGSGPDRVYPASNRDLARRILGSGGLIVSEYPPGTGPRKWTFPERNRIVSGLARGTVVVEAPERSGALITARLALEQGRDVWVDAVGLSALKGKGTTRLAEDGARVIESAQSILDEWKISGPPDGGPACAGEARKDAAFTPAADAGAAGLAASLAEYLDIKL